MTFADLQAECWDALPPIRKRLVGRETVNDFVTLAVENWAGEYLAACQDNEQRQVYVHALLNHLKRGHQLATGREPAEYARPSFDRTLCMMRLLNPPPPRMSFITSAA